MRIVITVPYGQRLGGAESMLWVLLRHLDRSQVDPHVVAFTAGPFEREIAALGVSTTVVSAGRLRQLHKASATVRAVARVLDRERPDLILNWLSKTQVYGAAAARLAGLGDRVVWWQHGMPNGHWIDRLATALPARAIGCSSQASATAQDRLWPHRQTFVVHPGIEAPSVASGEELDQLRESIGVPRDRVVVGIVGRLQPWKGQDRLLRALALLRARGFDVQGLIVGGDAYGLSPEYADALERIVIELNLEEAVTMTGHVDHVAPLVQLMDVLVNASDNEPFGIVLLEAMSLGVPVVAIANGGPLEIIEPHRSGALADSGDPQSLARALAGLVADPDLRRRLADEGKKTAERFSADHMAEEMQVNLERLVAQAP
jgi:glycosyltransferase involved in cell wall biosynthesis